MVKKELSEFRLVRNRIAGEMCEETDVYSNAGYQNKSILQELWRMHIWGEASGFQIEDVTR